MSDAPPSYSECVKQQGPLFGGAAPSQMYGAVPGQRPPAGHYPGFPAPGQTYPQPPAGQYQPYQSGYPNQNVSAYQGQVVVSQYPTQSVVVVGGCPSCRVGVLEDDFTCLGVCCAILFFPLGILCCLAMRQRRCAHCGAVFG